MTPRERIYAAITAERERQDRLHPETDAFEDGTGTDDARAHLARMRDINKFRREMGTMRFAHVLLEEVHEALVETDTTRLAAELVQTASVCVRWLEALARRKAR